MAWYSTGTVAVTNNSSTVTGTGTAFDANSRVGDGFLGPDGAWYEVTNIASGTVMSIKPNYRGATASGQAYSIAPLQGYVKDSADALRGFVNQYGEQLSSLGPWATAANPAEAREDLGLGDAAVEDVIPIAKGGTGAAAAADARANLGLGPISTWQSGQNLVLPGAGIRLQADFTNATLASRAAFQTSTLNGNTTLGVVPNGTGNVSALYCYNNANPASSTNTLQMGISAGGFGFIGTVGSINPWLSLYTVGTERVRVDASGNIHIGRVFASSPITDKASGFYVNLTYGVYTYNPNGQAMNIGVGTAGNSLIGFYFNGTTSVGSISTNGSTTAYNTTSDPRLKQDPESIPDGPVIFDAIEWVRWHWKAAPELGWAHGVLAPQLKSIFPEAVVGDEDAVDEEGNIIPMGVDYSKLVPILGAALADTRQQLRDALERITALEQERQTA
jgi:hypothetical protein